jgi:hypothetical protein
MSVADFRGIEPSKGSENAVLPVEELLAQLEEHGVEVLSTAVRAKARNLHAAPLRLVEAFADRRDEITAHLSGDAANDDGALASDNQQLRATVGTKPILAAEIIMAPALARLAKADEKPVAVAAAWSEMLRGIEGPFPAGRNIGELLDRAHHFLSAGWHVQAARMGWNELEVFGLSPKAPWERLDRQGIAFASHRLVALDRDVAVYEHRLRRQRTLINNDNGAVPIWQLAGDVAI